MQYRVSIKKIQNEISSNHSHTCRYFLFGTSVTDFDIIKNMDNRVWLLEQFAINYEAMMTACSEDNLSPEELQSCLDAFDEVREFCSTESVEQCDDKEWNS